MRFQQQAPISLAVTSSLSTRRSHPAQPPDNPGASTSEPPQSPYKSTATSIRNHINQLRFDHLYLMPYLLQELEEIQELPHPHLPEVLQVLRSSQVDVMTIKLPIYQLAIVDILPHHNSTMHKNPIHFFSNHRISSLQGTAYQGTDTRSQHPHTDILPHKPPAPEQPKASNQSIKIYHLHNLSSASFS